MNHLLSILLLSLLCLSGCILEDAFAAPGDEVLGVEMPGDFEWTTRGTATEFRFAIAGGAGVGWWANWRCSIRETEYRTGAVPPLMGPDADSGGFRPIAVVTGAPEAEGTLCILPPRTITLPNVRGRVFLAGPTDASSIDTLRVADQPWRAAVGANLLKCGRYVRSSGIKLVDVPCTDGVGGMLAPVVDFRGSISATATWSEF